MMQYHAPLDIELASWLQELNEETGFFFLEDDHSCPSSPRPNPEESETEKEHTNKVAFIKTELGSSLERTFSMVSASSNTTAGSRKALTAMEIFDLFTTETVNKFGQRVVDCSGIISRPCYEMWLTSRKKEPSKPEECFRKCILAHCTASDGGSAPFRPEVEAALLKLLRQPGKVWPCFEGRLDKHGEPVRIGAKGLRAIGYHEKQASATMSMKRPLFQTSPPSSMHKRVKSAW